jgi:hypothetical protein
LFPLTWLGGGIHVVELTDAREEAFHRLRRAAQAFDE